MEREDTLQVRWQTVLNDSGERSRSSTTTYPSERPAKRMRFSLPRLGARSCAALHFAASLEGGIGYVAKTVDHRNSV